jgi:DNA-binding XRE family transcriptional regulator|tara:strand:- start:262 stop:477 length:216 start_codon:yes stop_codon:yes gene_type:complete
MKLVDYLRNNKINTLDFANELGVSRQSIYNYIADPSQPNHAIPRPHLLTKIVNMTQGEVTFKDFYVNEEDI